MNSKDLGNNIWKILTIFLLVAMIIGAVVIAKIRYDFENQLAQLTNNLQKQQDSTEIINEALKLLQTEQLNLAQKLSTEEKNLAELSVKIPNYANIKGKNFEKSPIIVDNSVPIALLSTLVWSEHLVSKGGTIYNYKRLLKNLSDVNPKFAEYANNIADLKIEEMTNLQVLNDNYLVLIPKLDIYFAQEKKADNTIVSRIFELIKIRHIQDNTNFIPESVLIQQYLKNDEPLKISPLIKDIKINHPAYQEWARQVELRAIIARIHFLLIEELTNLTNHGNN